MSGDVTTEHDETAAHSATQTGHSRPTTPGWRRVFETIVGRELRTVVRTRTFIVLWLAFTAVVLGIVWIGDSAQAGYVPALVDLLTPLELLVPVLAIAFGYRAILGDERRGELDVLETYPISPPQHVLAVFTGRAMGLLVAVVFPLVLVFVLVAVTDSEMLGIYATHSGADSPVLFARFITLTALFALAVLAVALAISAVVSETRSALALSVVALVGLVIGLDLAIVYGFSAGLLGDTTLVHSLAISPLSAYRGLVFESAVVVAGGTGPAVASPIASLASLVVWTIGSLSIAAWRLNR